MSTHYSIYKDGKIVYFSSLITEGGKNRFYVTILPNGFRRLLWFRYSTTKNQMIANLLRRKQK
jgi:hypothetical protein